MINYINKIIQGNTLDILKQFPDECIDCVITSPPYWSLRDYGSETEVIWDGKEDCEHKWIEERTERPNSGGGRTEWAKEKLATKGTDNYSEYTNYGDRATYSKFCIKCGAWNGQLGLEPDFNLYIKHLIQIFNEVKRVLKKTGTLWVNIGDTYYTKSGSNFEHDNKCNNIKDKMQGKKPLQSKCLCQIPSRFSIAMTDNGWILRNEIIWFKRNCMPSSTKDRFTVDFEKVFFFVKNKKYYFEQQYESLKEISIKRAEYGWHGKKLLNGKSYNGLSDMEKMGERFAPIQGRNKRCVWDIPTQSYNESHFATFPEELVKPMIMAGCPKDGVVMDIFAGSGTALKVARDLRRDYVGIELNPKYIKLINKRLTNNNGTSLKELLIQ